MDGIHAELTSQQVKEAFAAEPSSLREGAECWDRREKRTYRFVRREAGVFSLRNATWKFLPLT
jgi:hypothetical protein